MLLALTLIASASTSPSFSNTAEAFDEACRIPGANLAAQRTAIRNVAKPSDPQGKGSETYDGPAGRYLLLSVGNTAMCGLNTRYDMATVPSDLPSWIKARYGADAKAHSSKGAHSYTWLSNGRTFKLVFAGGSDTPVLLFTANDER